jgi:hypothetical protein
MVVAEFEDPGIILALMTSRLDLFPKSESVNRHETEGAQTSGRVSGIAERQPRGFCSHSNIQSRLYTLHAY